MTNLPKKNSILLDIFLTIITLGFFNLWVQIRQCNDVNQLLNREEFSVFFLIFFSIITLGLYFVWHEYKMTKEVLIKVQGPSDSVDLKALLGAIAAAFGLWFIIDSYQQDLINKYIENQL